MNTRPYLSLLCALLFPVAATDVEAVPVISELMFRPSGLPEPVAQEFVEITNTGATELDLSGWSLDKGVTFTFPAGSLVPAGEAVVVVAHLTGFRAVSPGVPVAKVYGPWTGSLSNSGETVRLVDPTGVEADSVHYYTEGDWGVRSRSAPHSGVQGWEWTSQADGGGRTLERRNLALPPEGQNWGSSQGARGTPAAVNSLNTAVVAPFIWNVKHSPAVPRPAESVKISASLSLGAGGEVPQAAVYWRVSNASPGAFTLADMARVGGGAEADFEAVLPAQPDQTIVEFYVQSSDGVNTRTWPAPASTGQTVNCLYQVSSEVVPEGAPVYRLVLSVPEHTLFTSMTTSTDAAMNTTFIADDGAGPVVRYRCDLRYRGASSRDRTPPPMRLGLPDEDAWNGGTKFNFNTQYTWLQYTGMKLAQASGVRAPNVRKFSLRRNGINPMASPLTANFGFYAELEPLGREFVENHFADTSGDLYKKVRPDNDWAYRSGSVAAYQGDGWNKATNTAAWDWTQLDNFLRIMNLPASAPDYQEQVETVADLNQWARWFAVEALLTNGETNASNGADDDYSLYFRSSDHVAEFVPHDFDTILGQGDGSRITNTQRTLFDMTEEGDALAPLTALFGTTSGGGVASFRSSYFAALRNLCLTSFSQPEYDALLDRHLTGWVEASRIAEMKTFMNDRRAWVLGQCATALGTPTPVAPAPTATTTLTRPRGSLALSEVMAKNTGAWLSGGSYPDYVELVNTTAAAMDLTGVTMGTSATLPDLFTFTFPAGTVVLPGEYVLVETGVAVPSGLQAAFTLDEDGGSVYLRNAGGTLLDSISYGPQIPDLSISRTGDGTVWTLTAATPGAANGAPLPLSQTAAVRINEWLALPRHRSEREFIELHNTSALPAPLGRLHITDQSINSPGQFTFPPLSYLAAGGFYAMHPTGKPVGENFSELPFQLAGHQDYITLTGANFVVIDRVNVLNQRPDLSQGLSPDGGANWETYSLPTPGMANATAATIAANPAYARAVALLNGLRVSEVMYNPGSAGSAQTMEFVEIRNIGTTPLDVTGVRFSDGVGGTIPGGILAPGAFGLIVADPVGFESAYGPGLPVLGTWTGQLANGGETLGLRLPHPFEAGIQRFAYKDKWYPSTDGEGSSLTAANVQQSLALWDEREGWTAAAPTPGSTGPPAITSPAVASGTLGVPFSYQIQASNEPSSYGATGLPDGLSVNPSTGLISGTALSAGSSSVTLTATSPGGTGSLTLTINIALPPPPVISSALSVPGYTTAVFSYTIQATNNPTSWDATGLPAWLTWDAATHTITGQPTELGVFTVEISATNQGGTTTQTLSITVSNDPIATALDSVGLAFSRGGAAQWFVQSATTHDGIDALQAGDINDSEETWVETVVTGPDQLSFWWKIDSEGGFDYLNFNVDGNTVEGISGTVDWQKFTWIVPAGTHTLRWIYRKDGSVSTVADTAWLDEVILAAASPQPVIVSPALADAFNGESFTYQIQATKNPVSFGATGLPAGLTLDAVTGVISGVVTAAPGRYNVTISATGATGTGSSILVINVQTSGLAFAAAVEAEGLTLTRGGNVFWSSQTTTTHDGVDAGYTRPTGPSQTSWVETTVTGPDRVSFWWRNTSPNYYVYASIRVNGSTRQTMSGTQGWTRVVLDLPEGVHTLRWDSYTYSSNGTIPATDGTWLDQVTSANLQTLPGILSPLNAQGQLGEPFSYQIIATKSPESYAVSPLPPGLVLDPATGLITGTPQVQGITSSVMSATSGGLTGTEGLRFQIIASPAVIAAAAGPVDLAWRHLGDLHWNAQTVVSHDGNGSLQAPGLAYQESAVLSTTVTGPDRIGFWWRQDTTSTQLYFQGISSVGGNYFTVYAGNGQGWQYVVRDIPQGTYTLTWSYYNYNTSAVSGATAWVDDIRLASLSPVITSALTITASAGSPVSYTLTASRNPVSYSLSGLPPGLLLDTATGVLSGTTSSYGNWPLVATVETPDGPASAPVMLNVTPSASPLAVGADGSGLVLSHFPGSNSFWFNQNTTTHDGVDALQSGPVDANGASEFSLQVTGPGTLSFWWRVSSEYSDYLAVYDNNSQEASISGEQGWALQTIPVSSGPHTIRFQYRKSGYYVDGTDAGWVDQLSFLQSDTDSDALGDAWESEYFSSLEQNGSADPDGDGFTNAAEQRAGTNPMDAASALRMTHGEMNADKSFNLSWASVPGHSYAVEFSYNLVSWNTLLTRAWSPGQDGVANNLRPALTSGTTATILAENAACRAIVPSSSTPAILWRGGDETAFAALGGHTSWLSGTGGVGYERDSNASGSNVPYTPYIGLNLASMYNTRGSAFIRIPFTVTDPAAFQNLIMSIRYDDGFSAWLNGQFICSDNVPWQVEYDSTADTSRNDSDAVSYKAYNISGMLGALKPGTNILAIQGLNQSSSSSDFLIQAKLTGQRMPTPLTTPAKIYWRVRAL